jgi:hypothetical protein
MSRAFGEYLVPGILSVAQHRVRIGPSDHWAACFARRAAGTVAGTAAGRPADLGAADQQAWIDAERPTDQTEDDDCADTEPATRETNATTAAAKSSPPRSSSTFSSDGNHPSA